jgi:hypothetical protein
MPGKQCGFSTQKINQQSVAYPKHCFFALFMSGFILETARRPDSLKEKILPLTTNHPRQFSRFLRDAFSSSDILVVCFLELKLG